MASCQCQMSSGKKRLQSLPECLDKTTVDGPMNQTTTRPLSCVEIH